MSHRGRRSVTRRRAAPAATAALLAVFATGCGASDDTPAAAGEVSQTVEFVATEYAFVADPSTAIAAGETVRIVLRNEGQLRHELQLLDRDGRLVDRVDELAPGAVGDVVVTFASPGVYQVICDVDDHLTRGQRASFTVDG